MSDGRVHSRFGGSSASLYLNCVGSTALLATLVDPPSGKYADGGSAKHKLAEICLRKNCHPNAFLGTSVLGPLGAVTVDMCDDVVAYLNAIETEMTRSDDPEVAFEEGFEIAVPAAEPGEVYGFTDCRVYHPSLGRLRMFDFKGGFQEVEVDDNDQLKFYATGAVFSHPEWRLKEIILTVVQPGGLNNEDVRDWTFNVVELLDFKGQVEDAIAAGKALLGQDASTLLAGGHLKVGHWCAKSYCTAFASGMCPAVEQHAMNGMGFEFDGMTPTRVTEITPDVLPDPAKLDAATLAKVVAGLDFLTTWAGRCQQYLEAMVLGGHQVPGWKAVEKIGRAKWIDDPAKVVAHAQMLFDIEPSQLTPPKLVTITDAVKLLKAAGATTSQIDDFKLKFTLKESSGLTIAPSSDRRPAADPVAADFAGVNVTAIAAE